MFQSELSDSPFVYLNLILMDVVVIKLLSEVGSMNSSNTEFFIRMKFYIIMSTTFYRWMRYSSDLLSRLRFFYFLIWS